MNTFHMKADASGTYYIMYSDCEDTQLFKYGGEDMALLKLTKKVCHTNSIERIHAARYIKVYKDEFSEGLKAILIDYDLNVYKLDLTTLKMEMVANLGKIIDQVVSVRGQEFDGYDAIFNFACYNESTGLLAINFINSAMFIFKIQSLESSSLYWELPKSTSETSLNPLALCMSFCPENEKAVVAYDTNKIVVFDINNKCLHHWSRISDQNFPSNFLNRYNRLIGCCSLSSQNFILYSNYTYTILDTSKTLLYNPDSQVKIIQDHPGKTLDHNSGWFDCLKKSQGTYINQIKGFASKAEKVATAQEIENLTISNSLKGILHIEYNIEKAEMHVVENQWRKAVERFPGALALPKFGM